MTKDEFEQGYAERSGITIERLHALGRYAEQCDCGDELCKGWQMAHDGSVLLIRRSGDPTQLGAQHDANVDLALVEHRFKATP